MRHEREWGGDYHAGDSSFDDYEKVCRYDYRDQWNHHLHIKVRWKLKDGLSPDGDQRSKQFTWVRLEEVIGTGHYNEIPGRGDEPVWLYRSPALFDASHGGIRFVCEGEKDVETLLNLNPDAMVTTAPSIWEWPAQCTKLFAGTDVVIIPDNDEYGERYVEMVGRAVAGVAKSVRVLKLFGPDDMQGADFTDWVQAKVSDFGRNTWTKIDADRLRRDTWNARDELERLIEKAPNWRVTLNPQNPRPSAKELVNLRFVDADAHRKVHRHKGGFYIYTGSHYRDATDEELKATIWEFLDEHAQRLIPVKPPKVKPDKTPKEKTTKTEADKDKETNTKGNDDHE